jgi:hypothetical protein
MRGGDRLSQDDGAVDATKAKRRKPSRPRELRKEVVEHVRSIARKHRAAFKADRELKARVLRLTRALLPPRPRPRGRPRNPETTRALALYRKFRRESPDESLRKLWARVYPRVIDGWANMSDLEQRNARDELRERIVWRRRKRRKIPAEISIS